MAAAPETGVTTSEVFGALSPELALVDSDLASWARALLPDVPEASSLRTSSPDPLPIVPELAVAQEPIAAPPPERRSKAQVFPVTFPDNGTFVEARSSSDALNRLVDYADAPEIDTPRVEQSPPDPRRRLTIVPTSSAATATALLLLQLYVGSGTLG